MSEGQNEKPRRVQRGSNVGKVAANIITDTATDEMDAMEQLGRNTRAALCDAPIKFSAISVLQSVREHEEKLRSQLPEEQRPLLVLDPKNLDLDMHLARGLMMQSVKIIAQDRSIEDAQSSIRLLRPRRTVRPDYRR